MSPNGAGTGPRSQRHARHAYRGRGGRGRNERGGRLAGRGSGIHHAAPLATDFTQDILNMALMHEHLTMTRYYGALTSRAIMSDARLAPRSASSPDAQLNRSRVHMLQAALDADAKHGDIMAEAGAMPMDTHFYFPAQTFERLGHPGEAGTLLGVANELETACVGKYLVMVHDFIARNRVDLAVIAAQIMGVEAEHRMIGHLIAGGGPTSGPAIEAQPFMSMMDLEMASRPYLTGNGFPHGATRAMAIPTRAQCARAIGTYGTRIAGGYI